LPEVRHVDQTVYGLASGNFWSPDPAC